MMKKLLLLILIVILSVNNVFSQTERYWKQHTNDGSKIVTDKGVARQSFPKEFKLFDLQINTLRQDLFSIVGTNASKHSTIISLPNADGGIEQFEVYEASNFEADLQAQFPDIRAYSGKGINDVYATLKISISPQGIQTMIFRTDKENEFIEPYSQDHSIYAVFKSQRQKGSLAWTCATDDQAMAKNISSKIGGGNTELSSAGQLKTMRLAQSCNAEYANYFGATSAAQVGLVMAAFNATITRCNGVYEKDLALHLNLVASTTNVIYYNTLTDPYSATLSQWNSQLQQALNTTLTGTGTTLAANNAAYDIGHMFGASGGGGNAGCIGCVCVDGVTGGAGSTKGRGITSPADGIPQGDNFDIDYVVHEVGHQLGGNHTFSNSNEGSGVSKEIGSGVTIMGYAGITAQDVAPHSIDIYHETTIEQIQNNLATKTCPITTSLAGVNATPVVAAFPNYTIPISTPFVLTGSATDANVADALTYCWEQNDDGGSSTGANSSASITKTVGPNFLTFLPTASPSRYFPRLSTIIANSNTTAGTGDAGILIEALSSVSRILNFRLTVRDNSPYSSTAPIKVGQTSFTDTKVTVTNAAGPFLVSAPNTTVSWEVGTNQLVTWAVAGTNANGVNATFVDIFLSTDGGLTYPIQLASKVPNDGTETITVPNNVGTSNRIMVRGYRHIFFDISNANFAITAPTSGFAIAYNGVDGEQNKEACAGTGSVVFTIPYTAYSGFSGATSFSVTGNPTGSTATFSPTSLTANGNVTLTISNTASSPGGLSSMIVTATSGASTKTVPLYLQLYSAFSTMTLSSPANLAVGQPTSLNLTWVADPSATSYDVQVANDASFSNVLVAANVTTNSYALSGLSDAINYFWRVLPKNSSCSGVYSAPYKFTTGQTVCSVFNATNVPLTIATTANVTVNSVLNIASTDIISDANITLDITHTWINDLKATLTSPSGTSVILFANPCSPTVSINNIAATFDDAGTAVVCGNSPGISGTVLPSASLSAFNGQSMNGNWTLTILDSFNGDGGSLNSWSLNLCKTIPALATQDANFQNFVLYPNPSNGNFNIQFNSASSNQIKIGVYDMRGRQVFSKAYQNNGFFNENLQLNTLQSGVYLVNVEDGENKIVKRIIIE